MKMIMTVLLGAVFVNSYGVANAESAKPSKYAGQEKRQIKSLSEADIAELRRGGGWGLAKVAELNGLPGPAHLLELKDQIPLTAPQIVAISKIYKSMKAKAVAQGEMLIVLERRLDRHAKDKTITDETLRALVAKIAVARGELRYIHLSTHMKTPVILSAEQIEKYNALHGYAANPCAKIPAGHDPVMWRKHNNCT